MASTKVSKGYLARTALTPMLAAGTTGALLLAVAAVVFTLVIEPPMEPAGLAFFLWTAAVFGGFSLFILIGAVRHRVGLAADENGITLGRPLGPISHHGMWWRTPVVTVPWRDIDAIVLFRLCTPTDGWTLHLPFVGIRLRPGAGLPPGEPKGRGLWVRLSVRMGQPPAPSDVDLYRQVFGYRLDQSRLAAAIAAYAPGVKLDVRPDECRLTLKDS
jgi:hypothetical protein